MHEAKTVGIFRSVRFLGKNTIGQFFREVSEICDGCTAAVYEKNWKLRHKDRPYQRAYRLVGMVGCGHPINEL